jgi:deazaflavin-dependent oxidoreductase (nitroreductase family)
MRVWIGLGLPPQKYQMLAVKGRRSGRLHTTPVSVMKMDGQRWLVVPYGVRDWVKNARAAGKVTLSRGGRSEVVAVQEEHDPSKSAPVLKLYLNEEPITRTFFDAKPGSPVEDYHTEAHRHPVFRIVD